MFPEDIRPVAEELLRQPDAFLVDAPRLSEVVVAGPAAPVSLGQRWDIAFEFGHLSIRLVHARRVGAAYVSTRPFMIERVFRAAHGGVRCEGGSVVVSLFPPGLIFLAYYNRPVPF